MKTQWQNDCDLLESLTTEPVMEDKAVSEELNRLLRDIEDDYYSMGRMDKADAVAGLVARNAALETELAEFRRQSGEVIDILDQPAPDTKAEPDDPDAPKVTGSPAEIWLVYGDIEEDCAHADCGEVSWCGHHVGNADVRYVRADLASRASPSQPAERVARTSFEVELDRLRACGTSVSEIISALVSYFGGLDDPRIGWCAGNASSPELFRCERCNAEHEDSTKIPHKDFCSVPDLARVLNAIRLYGESSPCVRCSSGRDKPCGVFVPHPGATDLCNRCGHSCCKGKSHD